MGQGLVVFWSWQSDHDALISRNFVKEAFEEALKLRNIVGDINFDSRPDPIELDHDTKGLVGPVDILDEIKKKIDNCDHYLADITPVGRSDKGKALANPNVMIELGYALRTKSIEEITFVANSHFYQGVADLPFDISKRRQPLTYKLSPKSANDKIDREKTKFANRLLPAIKAINPLDLMSNDSIDLLGSEERFSFLAEDCRDLMGWKKAREVRYIVPQRPYAFLQIAPVHQIRSLLNKELDPDAKGDSLFIGIGNGGDWVRQANGWTTVETVENQRPSMVAATKIFRETGLIWNIDFSNVRGPEGERYYGNLFDHSLFMENEHSYIDITNIPEHWYKLLSKALATYQRLGIDGPYDIRAGLYAKWPFSVFFDTKPLYKITGTYSGLLKGQEINLDSTKVDVVSYFLDGLLDAIAYPHSMPTEFIANALGVKYTPAK